MAEPGPAEQEEQGKQEKTGSGRDSLGRFRKGRSGNPAGRAPSIPDLRAMAEAAARDSGDFDLQRSLWNIVKMLASRAEEGDLAAAKILLGVFAGKPLVSITTGGGLEGGLSWDPLLWPGAPPGPIDKDSPYHRAYMAGRLKGDPRYGPALPRDPRVLAETMRLLAERLEAGERPSSLVMQATTHPSPPPTAGRLQIESAPTDVCQIVPGCDRGSCTLHCTLAPPGSRNRPYAAEFARESW